MPTALLVLNGSRSPRTAQRLQQIHARATQLRMGDGFPLSLPLSVIAVDGGAELCRMADIRPDLLIGDLDSVSPETRSRLEDAGVEVRREEDPSRNDLEKALDHMDREGIGSGIVTCFEGDRLDMLAGLLALLVHRSRPRLLLAGKRQLAERIDPGFHDLRIGRDRAFSLVSPVESAEIDLQGARWELDRHLMSPGCGGVSNVSTEDSLHISASRPLLLLRDAPWAGDEGAA